MVRTIVAATASAALCVVSVQPAMAQDQRFSGFDPPEGATATLNVRIPLGERGRQADPTYGFTVRYSHSVGPATMDARGPRTRSVDVADIRLARGDLRKARLGALDLALSDEDRRMNLITDEKAWMFGILSAAILGLALCVALICRGGRPRNYDTDFPDTPSGY